MENKRKRLERKVNELGLVMSKKQIVERYKWIDFSCGIKDPKLTERLLKEILYNLRENI